jgi:predicted RNA-binding Zn ribbon-like protein
VSPKESHKQRALFLAGHPALDFLNTRMRVEKHLVDVLQSDKDVLAWLKHAGLPVPTIGRAPRLLAAARALRENIRSLVEKRKNGKHGDPSILNGFLAAGLSYPRLAWSRLNKLAITTVRRPESAESILAPVAEAAANLLTNADFNLIRRCEEETCVLWFYDQTRSHRRRWCSMELCGNRHKVAAYRTRRRLQRPSA